MLKQTYRTIFICSCIVFIVDICRTTVRQSQNICMYIYMPACVWHMPIKRTSLCSSFRVFHKLITSRQQGKYDSSLIRTVSAVVVIIGISESVKDHKQRVWTWSSRFMSQAGKQQNFVDLCTLRTQKRSNVKHMAAAWSVDDSIQHVEKKHLWSCSCSFFMPPTPKFPKTFIFLCTCRMMFSTQVWEYFAIATHQLHIWSIVRICRKQRGSTLSLAKHGTTLLEM